MTALSCWTKAAQTKQSNSQRMNLTICTNFRRDVCGVCIICRTHGRRMSVVRKKCGRVQANQISLRWFRMRAWVFATVASKKTSSRKSPPVIAFTCTAKSA